MMAAIGSLFGGAVIVADLLRPWEISDYLRRPHVFPAEYIGIFAAGRSH